MKDQLVLRLQVSEGEKGVGGKCVCVRACVSACVCVCVCVHACMCVCWALVELSSFLVCG